MRKVIQNGKTVIELDDKKNQDGSSILVLIAMQHNKTRFNDKVTVLLEYAEVADLSLTLQMWLNK